MKLNKRQQLAQEVLAGTQTHTMLFGGSRSGKTFLLVRNVCFRALKAPNSRHAILRFRFNAIKSSIVMDTFPKVMKLAFPGESYVMNKTDFYAEFDNGSQIWFGGLDDKERTEKILGMEFATIYLNECSQIPWGSVGIAITRLAQLATQEIVGREPSQLKPRMYYDCVAADTVLDGYEATIRQMADVGAQINVLTSKGWRKASAPWKNGIADMLTFQLRNGKAITVTLSHRFWVNGVGWVTADKITTDHEILCTDSSLFLDGEPSAQNEKRIAQDSLGNCCKYHRPRDEQFHRLEVCGPVCPASSCDEERHSHDVSRRGVSGCRIDHHDQQEVQHIHHSQWFHGLPSRLFSFSLSDIRSRFLSRICGLSRQISRKLWTFLERSYLAMPVHVRFSLYFRPLRYFLAHLEAGYYGCESGTQSQQSIQQEKIFQSQKAHGYNGSKLKNGQIVSFDTPIESNGYYVAVDCIVSQPAQDCYTVEVPSCHHYVANGCVSHNCNPPSKAHWSYKLFVEKRDPDTKEAKSEPQDYAHFQINPQDNAENLTDGYLDTLKNLSGRLQKRFLLGEFADATANALFSDEFIDKWRHTEGELPDFVRVVVGVDPSGSGDADNADNDAIGICVGAIGTDGNAYLLEDCTVKAGPATWGKIATDAFDRHDADIIVGEINYGGAMVEHVIKTARPRTNYKTVTASRGKAIRAEPFSALYEQGKIRHVGYFRDLEDELTAFSTFGYTGENSPNRADAWVWVLAELFPGLVRKKKEEKIVKPKQKNYSANGWMG